MDDNDDGIPVANDDEGLLPPANPTNADDAQSSSIPDDDDDDDDSERHAARIRGRRYAFPDFTPDRNSR